MPVFTDATLVLNDRDLSGHSNEVSMDFTRSDLDNTTFRSGGKGHTAGLPDVSVSASGFWDADTDTQVRSLAGASGSLIIASSAAVGSPAYMLDAKVLSESKGGSVDELIPWSATFGSASRTGAARGVVLHDPTNAVTGVGASAARQLGSLGPGDYVDFYVHVFDVTGATPSLELELQSSATNGWAMPDVADTQTFFPGDVDVIRVTGPETNSWWRVNVSAVSGSALFIVTAAINS